MAKKINFDDFAAKSRAAKNRENVEKTMAALISTPIEAPKKSAEPTLAELLAQGAPTKAETAAEEIPATAAESETKAETKSKPKTTKADDKAAETEPAVTEVAEEQPIETDNSIPLDNTYTQQEQGAPIVGAPVLLHRDDLVPYEDNPFKLYEGGKLDNLVESIKNNGILSPLIVRPYKGKYQILAGHNRNNAAGIAGLIEVPCFVRDVDDDEAAIIMVETNYMQRGIADMLPSEIAKSLKIQLDALKHQGKKTDDINYAFLNEKAHSGAKNETLFQIEIKSLSRDKITEKNAISDSALHRYLRLNYLIIELLEMVDGGKIAVYIGALISHLTNGEQQMLVTYLTAGLKLDAKKANKLKNLSASHKLTDKCMKEVLLEKSKNKAEVITRVTKPSKRITDLFPADIKLKPKELEDVLVAAVVEYLKTHDLSADTAADMER